MPPVPPSAPAVTGLALAWLRVAWRGIGIGSGTGIGNGIVIGIGWRWFADRGDQAGWRGWLAEQEKEAGKETGMGNGITAGLGGKGKVRYEKTGTAEVRHKKLTRQSKP